MLDVVINTRTAFFDDSMMLVDDQRKVVAHYLRSHAPVASPSTHRYRRGENTLPLPGIAPLSHSGEERDTRPLPEEGSSAP